MVECCPLSFYFTFRSSLKLAIFLLTVCIAPFLQLMQGNIWVVPNSQGFAQSMTLLLRFQHRWSSIFASDDSSSEYNTNSNARLRGIKVLLAETDDLNRMVTRKLLEMLGCRVSTVGGSGLECLNAISSSGSRSQFEVVLLDLHMSEVDGFEVASRVRKFGSRNWPLIVALTTSGEEDVWERCLQVGMNGVIRKPVTLQGMSMELQRVLQGNSVASR